eukprot:214814-Alexandrium_andersonii.AAC.1
MACSRCTSSRMPASGMSRHSCRVQWSEPLPGPARALSTRRTEPSVISGSAQSPSSAAWSPSLAGFCSALSDVVPCQ